MILGIYFYCLTGKDGARISDGCKCSYKIYRYWL